VSYFKVNTIYCGDCKDVLGRFPSECIDLIYVDPPFFTEKKYEIIWGNGYELRAYEDRWKGGIMNYIAWMEPRLRECHRVLKSTGSMYLHCDYHASHYLKVLMDKIFGEDNFQNEIVWKFSKVGGVEKRWAKRHENILFYTKGSDWTFNLDEVREPYSESILRSLKKDEKGYYYTRGMGLDKKMKRLKKTYIHPKGKVPEDVWDLGDYSPPRRERLGYPTQKPEKLLERIIKASSNPMDIVLDPMCGTGTAIAVAHKLGRRWIGIDVSPTACRIMVKRMRGLGVNITDKDIIGLPKTLEEVKAMTWVEFQNWVFERLYGRVSAKKVGDLGIDGRLFDGTPVQVKQQESVGRKVVDEFETTIRRNGKKKGLIVAFSFTKDAYEEAARAKLEEGLEITLKTVDELIKED
jgi:DNA modification methylase